MLFEAGLSLAAAVTENGGDDLRSMLGRELPEVWSTSEDTTRADAAVALAFATAWNGGHTEFRSHIDAELEKWAADHGQDDRRRIRHLLRTVNTELVTGWHEWLRELQNQQGKRKRKRR